MKDTCRGMLAVIILGSAVAIADAAPQGVRRAGRVMNRRGWIAKRVLSDDFQKQVGLREEQAKQLRAELQKLSAEAQRLEEAIVQASRHQGEVARRVLAEPGAKADEIMAIIERIGQYRTEQAKLATRQLLVIRDRLSDEQRQKAREILTAEARQRMAARAMERAKREEAAAK